MSAETPTFAEFVERRRRDIAARVAAHPDAEHLTTVGPRDLAATALRGAIEVRWSADGTLLARRNDSISTQWFTIADADSVADVDRLQRWGIECALMPEGVPMSGDDWAEVARALVAEVRRERERTERIAGTATTMAEAVAPRFLAAWSCRLDGDRVVGHLRVDEPSASAVAAHAAELSGMSAVGRSLFAPPSPWPDDVEITAELVDAHVRERGLIHGYETRPNPADVLVAVRAEVEQVERVRRRRGAP